MEKIMSDEYFYGHLGEILNQLDDDILLEKALSYISMTDKESERLFQTIYSSSLKDVHYFDQFNTLGNHLKLLKENIKGKMLGIDMNDHKNYVIQMKKAANRGVMNCNNVLSGVIIATSNLNTHNLNILAKQKCSADFYKTYFEKNLEKLKEEYKIGMYGTEEEDRFGRMQKINKEIVQLTKKYQRVKK